MTERVELAEATTISDLVDAWSGAMTDLRTVVDELGDAGWRLPSVLPGWTIADVVAHVGWIEHFLLGHVDPPHDPDWAALPHVTSQLSRITEVPVDLRRTWPRQAVLDEFDAAVARRAEALRSGPQDPATPATDPFGRPKTLDAVLRMRVFDTWVHGQDIRRAVGLPGATTTRAAVVTAHQIAGGLGYVWAKRAQAPVGATLTVRVQPPGVELVRSVEVGADGRGRRIAEPDSADLQLTMSFEDFVQLGCGREWPDSSIEDARGRVDVAGDVELAIRVLDAFNIAP